jgi:hypothetical protein
MRRGRDMGVDAAQEICNDLLDQPFRSLWTTVSAAGACAII